MNEMIALGAAMPSGSFDRQIWHHASLVTLQLQGLHLGYVDGRQASGGKAFLAEPLTVSMTVPPSHSFFLSFIIAFISNDFGQCVLRVFVS
jgi:hypothetical protein